ncbi:hypothetical protein [Frigoriglobus tundricola]|uniref:hypothetical protein n=1 Tax=Frigoriglobus tundricola TaxID=2774151 RepID=UPI00148EA41D|nr:hypothetical protein [Frigoriglobus tundricola]
MKLFFLASDLDASDAAGQLALLAGALPRDRVALAVGTLGAPAGAAADALPAPRGRRSPRSRSGTRWTSAACAACATRCGTRTRR